ncbi:cysteine desulfurase family protein [Paenibacillus sp. FSL H8-0332]|uniref:cysteine desulfurase family protein n=1 Tax=Paenibacillus sp. FSL H8-0332 TaxID=2954742 RepID=UPI0030CC3E3E
MRLLYLDYCASAPIHPKVYEHYIKASKELYANPSSAHQLGFESNGIVEEAREDIASILEISPREVIFTSGATESNNLAIIGVARAARKSSTEKVHIITSVIEHSSVFNCCKYLEEEGFEITYVPVDMDGRVSVETIKNSIKSNTILVSIMHVNNETGTIQPIDEISKMIKGKGNIFFHVDGVQGFTKAAIDLSDIDLYTLSGHKIGAAKGVGVLIVKENIKLKPMIFGGGQEAGLRSGTTNVPGVISLAEAIKIGILEKNEKMEYIKKLNAFIVDGLKSIPGIVINSPGGEISSPHILNISSTEPGLNSAIILNLLSKKGIIASSQSACSSKSNKQSRILMEMTNDTLISSNSVRFSFNESVNREDAEYLLDSLEKIIIQVRKNGRFAVSI